MTHPPIDVTDAEIDQAVAALRAGQLVAIPTETVYGLAADATNDDAVARVFALKGRPADRPVIVHLGAAEDLSDWAVDIPEYAQAWAEHFWPGPLTLVLQKKEHVSGSITAGQPTVACRVPAHPVALKVLKCLGHALVAPSANRYGQISPTTAEAVHDEFGTEAPMVLNGGPANVGIESTIVACVGPKPVILRAGMITAEALEGVGQVSVDGLQSQASVIAPGQVASHYAPRTRCVWVDDAATLKACLEGISTDLRLGYLGWQAPPQRVAAAEILADEPKRAAQQLYAALRELDRAQLDRILIHAPPKGACWEGIRDRLKRAATPSHKQQVV